MPKLTQAEVEEFLAGPRISRLGCIDTDGFPYVVPCNYLFEGGAFHVFPRARALWGEYLEQNGRCFLCIDAREGPYGDQWNKRVLVKGEARLLDGPRPSYRRDDPMAQWAFRSMRRYAPERLTDDDVWRALESMKDMGFRHFNIEPLQMVTWRGTEYPARYRNVYPDR
jgi:hypothetical protein